MTAPAWFVAGTDTGVGKTLASVALLHALRRQGLAAVGMKPVAAGAEPGCDNEDVVALRAASALEMPHELANPYCFADPVSPHIAAAHEGRVVDLALLRERFDALRSRAGAVVVEGAGGFCVPLGAVLTGADLAASLGLPVVLVVGLRLGCLNHALLTQEAIAARGLRLAGWVANHLDPAMREPEANVHYLQDRLAAPMLARWPWAPGVDPATLSIEVPSHA